MLLDENGGIFGVKGDMQLFTSIPICCDRTLRNVDVILINYRTNGNMSRSDAGYTLISLLKLWTATHRTPDTRNTWIGLGFVGNHLVIHYLRLSRVLIATLRLLCRQDGMRIVPICYGSPLKQRLDLCLKANPPYDTSHTLYSSSTELSSQNTMGE